MIYKYGILANILKIFDNLNDAVFIVSYYLGDFHAFRLAERNSKFHVNSIIK